MYKVKIELENGIIKTNEYKDMTDFGKAVTLLGNGIKNIIVLDDNAKQPTNINYPKMFQPLTSDQIKRLQERKISLRLPDEETIEALKLLCTHKRDDRITLQDNNDTTVTCVVCGTRFNLVDLDEHELNQVIDMCINIVESIKTYYFDADETLIYELRDLLYKLSKIPELWKIAMNCFHSYEQQPPQYSNDFRLSPWQECILNKKEEEK